MKVLGIDPGTQNLGWGLITCDSSGNIKSVDFGCIQAPRKGSFYERLAYLDGKLEELCQKFQPNRAIIEKIFLGKSVDSAFKLGHIRGICAARCQAAGAQVEEVAARSVKKIITGSGNADKQIVQTFLYQQLNIKTPIKSLDASDALALAFCGVLQDSVKAKHKGMVLR